MYIIIIDEFNFPYIIVDSSISTLRYYFLFLTIISHRVSEVIKRKNSWESRIHRPKLRLGICNRQIIDWLCALFLVPKFHVLAPPALQTPEYMQLRLHWSRNHRCHLGCKYSGVAVVHIENMIRCTARSLD